MTPGARVALVWIGDMKWKVFLKDWTDPISGDIFLVVDENRSQLENKDAVNAALLDFQEYDSPSQTDINREYP